MKPTRRALLSAGGASALALSLAACSKSQPKTAQTQASGTPIAEPVLNDKQLSEILQRVQTGLATADKEKNADKLKEVMSGPAARIRAAEYATASASGNNDFIHPMTTTIQGGGVGQTVGFPRNAAAASEGASPSLISLEQNSARDQFKVWAWVQGFSEKKNIPVLTKQSAQRAKQVTADSTGLVSTPKAALDAYIDALNHPDGENGKAFPDDLLRQKVQAARTTNLSSLGEVTVTATAGQDGFQGLQMEEGDGGALVFTTLTYTVVYKRTVDGSDLTLQGDVAALMGGNQKIVGTVTATYDSMVAFSIPKEGSKDKVAVLGAETALIKVDRDDSKTPAPTASASAKPS
ncbi:Tat pathway signal protein [Actinomyces naeslundii]|uniref:Tat pathway signal protein n=1 Tax=Actinomyces naeslundii TaxID=1655 RepID=A0AA47IM61_ACTNA|nr:Tat pathway signal protein [Actinomyces naeslundii]OLO86794.1 Tat pathway signal protein [Actinomyces naeslundii]OMG12137.1 Tat pathway signal protein [Actinomyces naeslundii]OMG12636.1 Tat pathway signal protein [Actinomyces naeslundii]OMG25180.1 Tat pathway signal protein [Actinomyces naeslundii]PKY95362.1 Tat pathway signal protein [Actinomyces naeslundii]